MIEEVTVDRERRVASFRRNGFGEAGPGRALRRVARIPPLQEEDVDHNFRSRGGVHCALRHPDRADQVHHGADMIAGGRIDLVHGPAGSDESREASRPQPLDRSGDEIIVKGKAQLPSRIVGADGTFGERRVADGEIIEFGQPRFCEILVPDSGGRIEELRDAGGGGVHLDAGERQLARKLLRREGEEEACAATRLQNPAAVEAHAAQRPPEGADHEFRGVIRVLRRPV
jgi:hypothetical protein